MTTNPTAGMVFQRFEAKYILTAMEAEFVKQYIAPYVTVDPHAEWGRAYSVNSMYLDNADLALFWSTEMGEKNRFKLRIRCYDDNPNTPVFFEIKRRVDSIIQKKRAMAHREHVARVLRGERIEPEEFLVHPSDVEMENLCEFRDLMDSISATPRAMVRYLREAYMSDFEEPARITFDTELTCLPSPKYEPSVWTYNGRYHDVCGPPVIMEVKFTDAFPSWIRRMIQRFHLMRDSFPKYVVCAKALKRAGIGIAGAARGNG